MNKRKITIGFGALCRQIVKLKSSRYDPKRTALFGKLIRVIKEYDKRAPISHRILTQTKHILINDLRSTFSLEQISIEKYWAIKIISSKNPYDELKDFPFYKGYISSAKYLFDTISSMCKDPIRKMLYIGGGGAPLNPILMQNKHNLTINLIERDNQSFTLSKKLLNTLKLNRKITVELSDIMDYKKLKNYDVIINAVLVGETSVQKRKVIRHISKYMDTNTLLVFKNVDGLRTILYPSVKTQYFKDLKIKKVVKNPAQLTNILIFSKKVIKNST